MKERADASQTSVKLFQMETFILSSSDAVLVTHSRALCMQVGQTNSLSLHRALFSSGAYSIKPSARMEVWLLAAVAAAGCGLPDGKLLWRKTSQGCERFPLSL